MKLMRNVKFIATYTCSYDSCNFLTPTDSWDCGSYCDLENKIIDKNESNPEIPNWCPRIKENFNDDIAEKIYGSC